MIKIIENPKFCNKMCVDGCYFPELQEIIVADKLNNPVLVHEIGHYLFDIGSTKYLDSIIDICNLLGVNFWDVVNINDVSEIVDDYEVLIDELCAYFVEEIYKEFPEVILESHPIYRIVLER